MHKQKESGEKINEGSEPRVVKGKQKEGLRKSELKKMSDAQVKGEINGEKRVSFLVRERDVRKELCFNNQVLVVMYKETLFSTNNLNPSLPSIFVKLLQEFDDVFSEDFPDGLPPLKGIEHQIDLVPSSSIPN